MKKGVTLRAQIEMAGGPSAAAAAAQDSQSIVSQVLAAGIQSSASPYSVTVQKVAALATPAAPAASQSAGHGASVSAQVYVEGDAAPADDFARIGQSVVARIFAAGAKTYYGPYTLTLGPVQALEGSDGDDDSDAG